MTFSLIAERSLHLSSILHFYFRCKLYVNLMLRSANCMIGTEQEYVVKGRFVDNIWSDAGVILDPLSLPFGPLTTFDNINVNILKLRYGWIGERKTAQAQKHIPIPVHDLSKTPTLCEATICCACP